VIAGLGIVAYILRDPIAKALEPTAEKVSFFDYGEHTPAINRLNEQLHAEPCDRVKILQLVKTYFRAGDYRSVVRRSDAFIKRCGKYNRLLWTTYEAHKRLSEWEEAIVDASTLIADRPYDKDFRWWRGIVHEQLGQYAKAARDYRQSIGLQPRLRSIPFNLANIYEKMDRPCAAIFPLEQVLHHHPDLSNREQIRARIDRLYRHPKCIRLQGGEGRAVIARRGSDGSRTFIGEVSINGGKPGRFIIDTGASYLSLSRRFAERNKIASSAGQPILLRTTSGVSKVRLLTLDSVVVGDLTARQVDAVVVTEELGTTGNTEIDGLLGLSFLTRFDVQIDRDAGQIVLTSRS
jgi:aspartyl protease family protein